MSRIGKKNIIVGDGVEVTQVDSQVIVKGPKGKLSLSIPSYIKLNQADSILRLEILDSVNSNQKSIKEQHGLFRSLVANMVEGVLNGFRKNLVLEGIGYRVQKEGRGLVFSLGYSHPVKIDPMDDIEYEVDGQNKVTVIGIDKQKVGFAASVLRKLRKVDPYKLKGVKYAGEKLKKKQGKSVKK